MATTKIMFSSVPFKNSIGQVIKVGDPVVAIAAGYRGSFNIYEATYIGHFLSITSGFREYVVVRVCGKYTKLQSCRIYHVDTKISEITGIK